MTVASYIPGEVIASGYGALSAAVLALAVGLVRIRERLARVEEWQRLHEADADTEEKRRLVHRYFDED